MKQLVIAAGVILPVSVSYAQSIEIEQQYTTAHDKPITEYTQTRLHADLQALLVSVEQRNYGTDDLVHSKRFTHLKVGTQYLHQFGDGYALWPRIQIYSGYNDSMTSDAMTYNPQLVGIRQIRPGIALIAGAGALINSANTQYYPVAGIVVGEESGSRWQGNFTIPQGLVRYHASEHWAAEFGLKWQTRYYDTTFERETNVSKQVMRTQDVMVSVGARYNIDSNWAFSARATYLTLRSVELYEDVNSPAINDPASRFGMLVSLTYDF